VSNQADSIKIACDFVSLDNLTETVRLVGEYREQRLSLGGDGDDVLQLYNLLWYAWISLSRLQDADITRDVTQNNTVADFNMVIDSDRFESDTISSSAMLADDPNPTLSTSNDQGMSAAQLRKIMRRKLNNRRKKDLKAYNSTTPATGDFPCQFCGRKLGRDGLIRHL
jgi:hypothetical protein